MEVSVRAPSFNVSSFVFPDGSVVADVLNRFVQKRGRPSDFYVVTNGRLSCLEDPLRHGAVYHLQPRLCGGKGGFGSMLRALGAQIEKTTNREACRDLSGRRLRDVNHEKEMAEWLKKQADRDAEKEQRRLERLQKKLAEPKHQFTDPEFQRQCHDLSERLEDSVLKGLQASSSGQVKVEDVVALKRPNSDQSQQEVKKKKKKTTTTCFWTGLDELPSSEDDEEESSSDCGAAAVTMTTQREPEASSSSADHTPAEPVTGEDPAEPVTGEDRPDPVTGEDPAEPVTGEDPTEPVTGEDRPDPAEPVTGEDRPDTPETSTDQSVNTSEKQQQPTRSSLRLSSLEELESLGLDVLKQELMSRGLKCGGTLSERAARLFSVRGLTPDQIDAAMLAKPGKAKRK